MKIALFLPNWVGDTVMATPALRGLREQYRQAELVAVLRPYVADVLAGLDLTDRFLFHDPRGREPEQRGWRFVSRLRRERFDLAVLFPNSLRSAWLAWLSGAKRRVGFARDGRGLLLTDRVPPNSLLKNTLDGRARLLPSLIFQRLLARQEPRPPIIQQTAKSQSEPHPLIDEYLRLAGHLGCSPLSRRMELAVLPEDDWHLDQFWQRYDRRLREREIVCLNPGGAYGSAKHWPTKSFGTLARRIAVELGRTVLVLCGPAERDEAREIVRRAAHPHVVSLADFPTTLGVTKAAIRQAELLVTTDSGPRHFAPPFDVPVVTLFGPTHIAWSETFYEKATHLQLDLDCGPCQQRVCPLKHHRCMKELTVDQVYDAVVTMLHSHSRVNRAVPA